MNAIEPHRPPDLNLHALPDRRGDWVEDDRMVKSIVHFVGFPDNYGRQFQSAIRVFGRPAFMHRFWDRRAKRDIAAADVVVFASGDETQAVRQWNGNDQFYDPDPSEPA